MEKIVIVGAGGFGREVEWLINRINKIAPTYEVIGYEGIKALPSGYLKKEPMDVLLFIVTQIQTILT